MEAKKRIYIGLLMGSMLMVIFLAVSLWYLIDNRGFIINKLLLIMIASIFGFIFIILGVGIIAIVIMIIRSKNIPSLDNITYLANEILFPITMITGRLVGISKEKILRSYIAVNNNLVKSKKLLLSGNQIMILLPHCLQDSECPHKITIDIGNCKQCGKCNISELIELGKKYNANIKVATGGTLARKFIEECKPRGVIAVACERDLSMGIQDSGHIPVLGVLNCRPNGPCFNTSVELDRVEKALQIIIKGG